MHVDIRIKIITALLAMVPLSANAEIDANVETVAQINYEPYSGVAGAAELPLTVTNSGTVPMQLQVEIRPQSTSGFIFERTALPVRLQFDGRENNLERLAFPTSIEAETTSVLKIDCLVDAAQFAESGEDTLTVDIEVFDASTSTLVASLQAVDINLNVAPHAQMSIAGALGGQAGSRNFMLVDFGEMESNEEESIQIRIQANTDAEVTISSENNGRMVHDSRPDLSADYSIIFDGQMSELASDLVVIRRPASVFAGTSYPLTFILGDTTQLFEGTYRDFVTIDVEAQ